MVHLRSKIHSMLVSSRVYVQEFAHVCQFKEAKIYCINHWERIYVDKMPFHSTQIVESC